jgi:hypothetical protein
MDDLERAGIPLDAMVQVLERGEVSLSSFDLPVNERFSLVSGTTFREASEQNDVPLDLLTVVREVIGSAEPGPDDLVREDELRILPLIELQIARGFRQAIIERWLRVYGESLRRVAETETEWWRTEIQMPQLESGLSVAEMLEVTNPWGEEMNMLTEQALLASIARPTRPAPGVVLPRHRRLHATHRGARRRGRSRAGGAPVQAGPAVSRAPSGQGGAVAGRRRDVLSSANRGRPSWPRSR